MADSIIGWGSSVGRWARIDNKSVIGEDVHVKVRAHSSLGQPLSVYLQSSTLKWVQLPVWVDGHVPTGMCILASGWLNPSRSKSADGIDENDRLCMQARLPRWKQ